MIGLSSERHDINTSCPYGTCGTAHPDAYSPFRAVRSRNSLPPTAAASYANRSRPGPSDASPVKEFSAPRSSSFPHRPQLLIFSYKVEISFDDSRLAIPSSPLSDPLIKKLFDVSLRPGIKDRKESDRHQATVDGQIDATDVTAFLRGQKQCRRSDFLR